MALEAVRLEARSQRPRMARAAVEDAAVAGDAEARVRLVRVQERRV